MPGRSRNIIFPQSLAEYWAGLGVRTGMVGGCLGFVAGVVWVAQWESLPGPWWWMLWATVAVYTAVRRRWTLLWLTLGTGWGWGYGTLHVNGQLAPELEGRDLLVVGSVRGLPDDFGTGLRFGFEIEESLDPEAVVLPRHVRLSWYRSEARPSSGERWQLMLRLKRPHGTRNPGGFDYESWLFQQGIGATGYVRAGGENRRVAGARWAIWSMAAWRARCNALLDRALAGHPARGLVKALVIGHGGDIPREQWAIFRITGTTHLVVVSGSHLALIAALGFFLLRHALAMMHWIALSPLRGAALGALIGTAGYAQLAGFTLPVQRALVMSSVVLLCLLLRRTVASWRLWLWALAAVAAWSPTAVLAPGFWLSYAAVALIFYTALGRIGGASRRYAWLGVHGVTAVGLAPLLLLFFQQISLVAPLANLIAVPMLGVLGVPAALLATLWTALEPVSGGWALHRVADALAWGVWLLEWLSRLPLAEWHRPRAPPALLLLAGMGVLWLLAPRGVPNRALGIVLLVPALGWSPPRPRPGDFQFTLLDVGQGLAAVVQTAGHTLVYDAGDRFGDFDLGEAVVAPFLHGTGTERIDLLVVSHGDRDHRGGVEGLRQRFPILQVSASVPEELPNLRAEPCRDGQGWTWDGVDFVFLNPPAEPFGKENDNSCVLRVRSAAGSVLLTGDIEASAEMALVRRHGTALRSEVLVAPHHGSRSSSTWPFLQAVSPGWVLIPAGHRNRYRFPAPEVVRRYRLAGAAIASSAVDGAIGFAFEADGGVSAPLRYRRLHRRYWHWH